MVVDEVGTQLERKAMLDLLLHSAVLYLANVDGLHEVPESVTALVVTCNFHVNKKSLVSQNAQIRYFAIFAIS